MNYAVVFAGGIGSRMQSQSGVPKQFLKLHGKTIIEYTLEHFENCVDVDAVAVAIVADHLDYMRHIVKKAGFEKVKWVVPGGASGQESIFHGLRAIYEGTEHDANDTVLIHDGVRPLIEPALLSSAIECVKKNGSAVTIVPAIETIITVDENGMIKETMDRSECRMARAPQGYFLEELYAMHEQARAEGKAHIYIDSASMMLANGKKLYTIEGKSENIKITTPFDFYAFKSILDAKENQQVWGI